MAPIELAWLALQSIVMDALHRLQASACLVDLVGACSIVLLALYPVVNFLFEEFKPGRRPASAGVVDEHVEALSMELARGHCPVCGCGGPGAWMACPECATPHHVDCADYNGGCAIYGCRARPGPQYWFAA